MHTNSTCSGGGGMGWGGVVVGGGRGGGRREGGGRGGGLLLLVRLQLDLLLSMKQEGFREAWQPAPVNKNWSRLPKLNSFFQRALKCSCYKKQFQKHRGLKNWQHCGWQNSLQKHGCDSSWHLIVGEFRVFCFRGRLWLEASSNCFCM